MQYSMVGYIYRLLILHLPMTTPSLVTHCDIIHHQHAQTQTPDNCKPHIHMQSESWRGQGGVIFGIGRSIFVLELIIWGFRWLPLHKGIHVIVCFFNFSSSMYYLADNEVKHKQFFTPDLPLQRRQRQQNVLSPFLWCRLNEFLFSIQHG